MGMEGLGRDRGHLRVSFSSFGMSRFRTCTAAAENSSIERAYSGMPKLLFQAPFVFFVSAGRSLPSRVRMAAYLRLIYMSIDRVFPNAEPRNNEKRAPSTRRSVRGNKTVTRADLAETLCRQFGLVGRESRQIVEGVLAEIGDALARGENIKLAGFGSFNLCAKRARPGRNPRNGVEATISPRKVLAFKPSKMLRELVNSSRDE